MKTAKEWIEEYRAEFVADPSECERSLKFSNGDFTRAVQLDALMHAAEIASLRTTQMPFDSDFTRGYTEGRLAAMNEIKKAANQLTK